MRLIVVLSTIIFCFTWWAPLNSSSMSGGPYEITADSFSFTSVDQATGSEYALFSSGGEVGSTSTESGTYILRGGFQAVNRGILSYTISPTALNLGTLSDRSVASASLTVTISTDSQTGYSLFLTEDGNLRSSSGADINDVGDGDVTAGQEEYGVRTAGADGLYNSREVAIVNNIRVAYNTGTVASRATTLSFRASRAPTTPTGNYSHTITVTAMANP